MKTFITFGLLVIISIVNAQVRPDQYVAQIRRYSEVEGNSLISLGGVVISDRHVLTSAGPLHNIPPADLRVYFSSPTASTSTDIRNVLRVHINPNNANLAVLETSWQQNEARNLELGSLPGVGSTCRAYFFNDFFGPLRWTEVVLRQTNCPGNNAWCGAVNITGACRGFDGAPVICTEDNRIAGIVFGESICAPPGAPMTPVANLINVATHVDWINEVTSDQPYGDSASMSMISVVGLVAGVILSKIL